MLTFFGPGAEITILELIYPYKSCSVPRAARNGEQEKAKGGHGGSAADGTRPPASYSSEADARSDRDTRVLHFLVCIAPVVPRSLPESLPPNDGGISSAPGGLNPQPPPCAPSTRCSSRASAASVPITTMRSSSLSPSRLSSGATARERRFVDNTRPTRESPGSRISPRRGAQFSSGAPSPRFRPRL